jgi:hypothetical protein
MCSSNNFVRDKVSLIRRYTGGGTVVVDENTGKKKLNKAYRLVLANQLISILLLSF